MGKHKQREPGVYSGKELGEKLLESVKEMKAGRAARVTHVTPTKPFASLARDRVGMSQSEFANMLGISVRTLQQWEQGRREPTGAARTLLTAAAKHPKELLKALAK